MTTAPRAAVLAARRIVVKIGSSSLTGEDGHLDGSRVDALAEVMFELRSSGHEVVLVSSGAIAAGLRPLGFERKPRDLATLQAAASVGQGLLVHRYAEAFARHGVTAGQVLLSAEDVVRRAHYLNAKRTIDRLLALGAVPIVNENDAVATAEIKFGDNDRLAALVANLVAADLLVLLSDVDALYDADPRRGKGLRIAEVASIDELANVALGAAGTMYGSGGMLSKVDAARIAMASGVVTLVGGAADARRLLAGEDVGTLFHAAPTRTAARLLWLAHAATPTGRLCLDDGAVRAVVERRFSLLPAGITGVEGSFGPGDPVDLVDTSGRAVARGFVNYGSDELPALLGRSTKDLAAELGPAYEREVVHRDDLALLTR
jgi:glutamate 5-kinase